MPSGVAIAFHAKEAAMLNATTPSQMRTTRSRSSSPTCVREVPIRVARTRTPSHMIPRGRRVTSRLAETPAKATAERGTWPRPSSSSAIKAVHMPIPAAISSPLGLIAPPMNATAGVAATTTPASTARLRIQCVAVTTAEASRAATAAPVSSRARMMPVQLGHAATGQPVRA
jgi:hypothetical protein